MLELGPSYQSPQEPDFGEDVKAALNLKLGHIDRSIEEDKQEQMEASSHGAGFEQSLREQAEIRRDIIEGMNPA
jgi:hypothetical protein